tara:strand:+ start:6858 stop:8081 length:1224 start_codon:yes stop_codon:yes gene_type:complete
MVIAAFFSQIMHSSLLFLSQGLYVVQFEQTFTWSRGAISWAFGLLRIETGLLGPLQGWMLDRFGPRPVMRIGTLLFGGGLILLGQIQELWHLFVVLTIIAMGTSLAGFLTVNTALAHWFVKKRARAMSVTSIGFASGALFTPVVAWSITEFGWRDTAMLSGIAAIMVGIPASQVFKRKPEDMGLKPDGAKNEPDNDTLKTGDLNWEEISFTVQQAVNDRSFWLISIGHGWALLVVGTVAVHLVPHLVEQNNWDVAQAALVFPGLMVAQIIGQVSGGIIGDLYSKRYVAAGAMVGHGLGLFIIAFDTSIPSIIASIALHGISWGMRGPLMMAIRADYFGRKNLGQIAGWSNTITALGSIVGPIYAGVLYDHFQSYVFAFSTLGFTTALGTLFFIFARKPEVPETTKID